MLMWKKVAAAAIFAIAMLSGGAYLQYNRSETSKQTTLNNIEQHIQTLPKEQLSSFLNAKDGDLEQNNAAAIIKANTTININQFLKNISSPELKQFLDETAPVNEDDFALN